MTEAEWPACADPAPMLAHLKDSLTDRKLRLYGCALVRRVWDRVTDLRGRQAVEASERFADGGCTLQDLNRAGVNAGLATRAAMQRSGHMSPDFCAHAAAEFAARKPPALKAAVGYATARPPLVELLPGWYLVRFVSPVHKPDPAAEAVERGAQAELLREVFGNPFRPLTAEPAWLTSTVLALAAGVYAEGAFDRLPILADALQDAGCDRADILTHCRGEGPHVRGCWVVDLLLGKV